ncbi:MAG: anaerobic ribonucleoside-triphosphate reductase activating protein [Oscillospiraceae bacterium]|nr:anaerobic ribonucleoside-triphosphate reductase activating protein [Oscillospiraceae bacterium]
MNIANIKPVDIADGIGVRVSVFVSGCRHHCKNCFNPETWSFDYGTPYTEETERGIIEKLRPSYIRGLTLLGGEPFEPENQRVLVTLLQRVREELPEKDIWSYSGYTFEQLTGAENCAARCEVTDEMLSMLDVLVDGEYVDELRNIRLKFRGSENQRILNVPESLAKGEPVLWKA